MSRKLLPYEHELIKALSVTEEEYLDFLTAQVDYTQSPEERGAIVRAEPLSTIALVLTIVGVIFQVAAALFYKPPEQKNQRQRRQERFSPRYGFNSSQELAQYGDVINLIYTSTEDNDLGGVRAATSLVWSAVESYGSSQFMQLLLVLGAAEIRELDPERFAFGQLSLRQVLPSKVWIYYDKNGRVKFNDRVLGDGRDPTRLEGTDKDDDVCKIIDGGNRKEGYSQAFSPSSMNVFGVFAPIPINVDIQERRTSGRIDTAKLGVKIRGENWQTTNGSRWKEGDRFTLVFAKTIKKKDKVAQEAAKDLRYQYVSSLDPASTYKLGTAKFRLLNISDDTNIDKDDVIAEFECIQSGRKPYTPYGQEKAWDYSENDREKLEEAEDILKAPYEETTTSGPGTLDRGVQSLSISAARGYYDPEDDRFTNLQTADFDISFAGIKYSFKGTETIKWETDVQDRDSEDFKNGSFDVPRGGSIARTKKLLEQFLAEKPTVSTKKLRNSLESDLEDLRDLRDRINGADKGIFNDLRQQAKQGGLVRSIRNQIDTLQEKVDDLVGERYGFEKNKNNDGLLKAQGTGLTKDERKRVAKLNKEIENLREDKDAIVDGDIKALQGALIRTIRYADYQFRFGGKTYAGGIKYVKGQLANLKGENTTDKRGVKQVRRYFRELIRDKEEALKFVKYVTKNWEQLQSSADDHFYTKCLVKSEEAVYQTVSVCDYVKFSIRCRIFRNLSGRAKNYGEKEAPDGFKMSDNGYKARSALFKLEYKRTIDKNWERVPVIFVARRGADQDNFIGLAFQCQTKAKWEFRIEPINDMGSELQDNAYQHFAFIQNAGKNSRFKHNDNEFRFTGDLVNVDTVLLRPNQEERGPVYTNEWDLFATRSDSQLQASFDNGPEFTITAVTEQQLGSIQGKYRDISMLALGVYSGLGMQDLRSITAYVTEGKHSYRINPENGTYSKGDRSTSWAPDIFADTILDRANGIGKYARPEGVDWQALALAKRFCMNSGLGTPLHMDGVIAEASTWRQFWVEAAPYSLLEFARIGGRETLVPAIPVTNDGRATRDVPVSALFNQGNILEGSYKEQFLDYGSDTQDLIATVIYRETEFKDVFPRNASVTIALKDVDDGLAIRQTFDLSQFVTRRKQAILFGKLMANQRRWIRRAIEFQTVPTDSPVSPGAYILVDIGLNTWDQLTTGVVLPEGVLNSPLNTLVRPGTYSMLLYESGSPTITLSGVTVDASGRAPAAAPYAGRLFVLGTVLNSKRVFRVSEVQMDEEGEVTIRATEYPCENVGNQLLSRVANFSDALFQIS
jgi:hypothetical protein